MLRKISWIVMSGALLAGASAKAQMPMPSYPGNWPYSSPAQPGYPGYGPPGMPMMPAPGMMPPPGYPNLNTMPNQPYMVLPDRIPDSRVPARPMAQAPSTAPSFSEYYPSTGSDVLPASYMSTPQAVPNEPYTVYEGPRYLSHIKEEGTRVWAQAGFLHWWTKQDSYPSLVTTGNANIGTLGNADTVVLFGRQFGPKELSGVQATLGMWLNPELDTSLEATGFYLSRHGRDSLFTSDATGSPLLSIPFLAPAESVARVAIPGIRSGTISANAKLEMHGADIAVVRNIARLHGWSFDYFGGLRYLYLNDDFALNQNLTAIVNNGVFFNGAGQVAGTTVSVSDSFNLTNRFFGAQFGGHIAWNWRRFDTALAGKISLGGNVSRAVINGVSTLNPGTANATDASGGLFAQTGNSGPYVVSHFATVPEGSATLGFHITPNLRVFGTYSLLYWSNVIRTGGNIDRNINPAIPPTSDTFLAGTTGSPLFNANFTDFWAHGINVGMELKY
ncbi:MAG: hypothetical protein EXS16_10285 [Gemmataceae bacterium]|nr:hypothetical protein [Gemmataceae bacterium]